MTQMELTGFNLDITAFEAIDVNQYPIDMSVKEQYHKLGKKVLRRLAEDLGLAKGSFEIRSNKGGCGVFGEITLHAEQIYIVLYDQGVSSHTQHGRQHCRVLYRMCHGLKDYRGCGNRWCALWELTSPPVLEVMRGIANDTL